MSTRAWALVDRRRSCRAAVASSADRTTFWAGAWCALREASTPRPLSRRRADDAVLRGPGHLRFQARSRRGRRRPAADRPATAPSALRSSVASCALSVATGCASTRSCEPICSRGAPRSTGWLAHLVSVALRSPAFPGGFSSGRRLGSVLRSSRAARGGRAGHTDRSLCPAGFRGRHGGSRRSFTCSRGSASTLALRRESLASITERGRLNAFALRLHGGRPHLLPTRRRSADAR